MLSNDTVPSVALIERADPARFGAEGYYVDPAGMPDHVIDAAARSLDAMIANVVKNSAYRSRCSTWDDAGAGLSPNFAQTWASTASV